MILLRWQPSVTVDVAYFLTFFVGPDQHSFSGDGKEKHTAGDILHFKNPENVYCHHMVLHVVKRKPLEVTESQIKDLAEHIITTLEKDGFKSFGLYLQYSEDHFWHDYSCKLVEGLLHVSSSKKLKCPVTVYCFGNKDSFEDLDEFLENQLNLATDLKPVVIETTSHQGINICFILFMLHILFAHVL